MMSSLAISSDGKHLYTATENALFQDGDEANLEEGSLSRVIRYDLTTGEADKEFVYLTEEVTVAPSPPDAFDTNGLVELLALDDTGTLLSLERSFSTGVGNTIKIFEILPQGTTDVKTISALDQDVDTLVEDELKRELVDLADLGINPDNVEGMTLGPVLPDGRQSLILVSDNNFSDTQETQFITLALDVKTLPSVIPTLETPNEIRYGEPDNPDTNPPEAPNTDFAADSDDPAIYVHPTDSAQSFVIYTLKNAGLVVRDLQGATIQRIQPDDIRYNNVDLIYGFQLGDETVDLAIASDRVGDTIAIFKIDPNNSENPLTDITSPATQGFDPGETIFPNSVSRENTAYGLAAYTSPFSGKSYVFASQSDGDKIAQLELVDAEDGTVEGRFDRFLNVPIPPGGEVDDAQVEGMVVDRELGLLYAAQEEFGILKYDIESDNNNPDSEPVDAVGNVKPDGNIITADIEGLTIYYGANGTGYLLASSQGNSTYAVYERGGNNNYIGSFDIGASNGIDEVNDSDGADVINVSLGEQFPFGLFVVQDGSNEEQSVFLDAIDEDEYQNFNTNFKLIAWEDVAAPFDLDIDTESFDPRGRVINGTNQDDTLTGGAGDDTISGKQGNDTLNSLDGNDMLFGGKDDDLLFGGDGNDTLAGDGESIAELLNEDPGNDTLVGGNGEDTLYIQKDDLLVGGGPGSSTSNSAFNQSLSEDPLKLSDTEKNNLGYFDGAADNFVFLDDGNGYTATIVGYESIDKLDLSAFGVASAEDFVDSQEKDGGLWWEYKTPKSSLDAEVVLRIDAAPGELAFV